MPTYPEKANFDLTQAKIGVKSRRDETCTATGAETWAPYTLLGRVASSGNLVRYTSNAANGAGSDVPVALVGENGVEFTGAGNLTKSVITAGTFRLDQLVKEQGGALTEAEIDDLHRMDIFTTPVDDQSKYDLQ